MPNLMKYPVILIVEDERTSRILIENALADYDYYLVMAEDGKDALDKINEFSPDLIMLDISIPGIDGLTLLNKIKKNELTRLTPVVMITASTEKKDRIKAIEMGADDFLIKPFDLLELQTRVRSLLRTKTYLDEIFQYKKQLESKVNTLMEELKSSMKSIQQASNKIKSIDDSCDLMKELTRKE